MASLKKLLDRRAALTVTMRDVGKLATEEERSLNEEEQPKYDSLKTELTGLNGAIALEEEIREAERKLQPVPDPNQLSPEEQAKLDGQRQEPVPEEKFKSFGHFLQAVATSADPRGGVDQRLMPQAAISGMSETIPSDGGFLVGIDTSNELLKRVNDNSQILNGGGGYSGVRKLPISSNSNGLKINAINETDRATGSRWGGVQVYWAAEAAAATAKAPKFRQIELNLKKLIGLSYATDELLQDTAALEAVTMQAFGEEFAFVIQDGLVNGPGAGQILGIVNGGSLVSVAKETGQVAKTVIKANIDNMYSQMYAKSIPNSVWHINQNVYPQLFGLTQDVGTGGLPVYLPPGGLSASPYGQLYGRPVVPIEQCPTAGTLGDILFCDWSQYVFAEKGGLESASSIHVRFINHETTFRFVYRCDGQPAWNSALTPYKDASSTKPVSPFIGLAARA